MKRMYRCKLIPLLLSMAFQTVQANPVAPEVVAGAASFQANGSALNVVSSTNAIINWQRFSIDPGEITRFIQPSQDSTVLNRVLGGDPSQLLGQLQSNGKVFLVNPAGIVVGPDARIDVGSFVASTLNITDADFLAHKLNFQGDPQAGMVRNLGHIKAGNGGSVLLVAPNIENAGTIISSGGEILLAAGQRVEILDSETPGVKVQITGDGTTTNLGAIIAEAGRVGAVGALIKNSGRLSASSAIREGGSIFLRATKGIELTGSSDISADGTEGGKVDIKVVRGEQLTGSLVARGSISAKGDGVPGTGGFIETSAAQLNLNGLDVVTAGGSWLLDPYDFTVASSGGDMTGSALSTALASGNVSIQTSGTGVTCSGATCGGGSSTGTGDIFLNDPVSVSSSNTLSLNAWRNINITQPVGASGTNSFNLTLSANGSGGGGLSRLGSAVNLNGGTLQFGGGNLYLGDAASIARAVVTSSSGKEVAVIGNAALDAVTLATNLQVAPNGSLTIRNGLTLNSASIHLGDGMTPNTPSGMNWDGTQTIGGTGEIVFNSPTGNTSLTTSWHATGGWTLTIDKNITVRADTPGWFVLGSYGTTPDSVINNGTLQANAANAMLFVNTAGSFTNNGTLKTTAGELQFNNATNAGKIEIGAGTNIGTHDLSFTNGINGTISGSGSFFTGDYPAYGTLINAGTIIAGNVGTIGSLGISGNLINNGTIRTKIGGTAMGQFDMLAISGNLTLGGTLAVSTTGGYTPANLDAVPFLTTTGVASGTFATVSAPAGFSVGYNLAAGEAGRLIYSANAKTFTNASGGLNWENAGNWSGASLPGSTDNVLINAGYAVTHGSGTDTVNMLSINSGNSLSVSGGSLSVTGMTNLGGTLTAAGGTLNLNGGLANTGTLGVSSGTLNLAGTYTPTDLGHLLGSGGALRLTGTLMNTGGTLTLDNSTGNFSIDGTVAGGTLATASGSSSKFLSSNGTLDAVTIAGNVEVSPGGNLTVRNGLTFSNGRLYLGDGATNGVTANLWWNGTQTISGNGEVIFNAPGGASVGASYHASETWALTIGSGITIRSANQAYNSISGDQLINNGTLAGNLVIGPQILTNNGLIRATSGSSLWFSNLASNTGTIQIDAGASATDNDNADLVNAPSGIIKGSGTLFVGPWQNAGARTLVNNGLIAPGDDGLPGTLTITGGLINNGTIRMRLSGTAAGQFDALNVTGNTVLGGTLVAATVDGYTSATPVSIPFLMTDGTVSGTFAKVTLPSGFSVAYNGTSKEAVRLVSASFTDPCLINPGATACSTSSSSPVQEQQQQIVAATGTAAATTASGDAAITSNPVSVSSSSVSSVSQLATAAVSPVSAIATPTLTLIDGTIGGTQGQFGGDALNSAPSSTTGNLPVGQGSTLSLQSSTSTTAGGDAGSPAKTDSLATSSSSSSPAKSDSKSGNVNEKPTTKPKPQKRPAQCT